MALLPESLHIVEFHHWLKYLRNVTLYICTTLLSSRQFILFTNLYS
jgi:hypothetical protein